MDTTPGPSGISRPGDFLQTIDDSSDNEDSMKIFAERVTIAGLEEAHHGKLKIDRIMFRFALIFAFLMITCQSYQIIRQYRFQRPVFIDFETPDADIPFPNVSVCFPTFINETRLNEFLIFPPRILSIMEKHNITKDAVKNYMKNILTNNIKIDDVSKMIYVITRYFFDSLYDSASQRGIENFWEFAFPTCSEILSNCAFGGQQFDCCQKAEFLTLLTSNCFQIRHNWVKEETNLTNDPLRLQDIGLTFDVATDWTFPLSDNESASDGFHIFVGTVPGHFKVPTPVPAYADVLIILSEPAKYFEQTACRDDTPKLKTFSYYDVHGSLCIYESIMSLVEKYLGCQLPILSNFPIENSCNFEQIFIAQTLLSDSDIEAMQKAFGNRNFKNKETELFGFIKTLKSEKSSCLPLCSRWEYSVLSSSYGFIQYRNDTEIPDMVNRSWSRVRVILPHTSYLSHREEHRAVIYLAMCDIGGVIGVYAGFSMVTFIQVAAYGILVMWSLWRKGTV